MKPKKERPLLYLLMIPGMLIVDALILTGTILLDGALFSGSGETMGHGFPVISLLSFFVLSVVTVIVFVLSVVFTIASFKRKRRAERERLNQPPF